MSRHSLKNIAGLEIAADQLLEAASARKCWACNCLVSTLATIDKAVPSEKQSPNLQNAIEEARAKAEPPEIECRGCEVCFPAVALNALAEIADPKALEVAVCPDESVTPCDGWPPLAGNFTVLGYQRPVAICTLNSEELLTTVAATHPDHTSIVGMLNTENLGIERLIQNVAANPNIRFLILCGEDSEREIGHLPGQSLLALGQNGIGERSKIIGAQGRRPVLRNVGPKMIEHFRNNIEIVDMIGEMSVDRILSTADLVAAKNPGPAEPVQIDQIIPVERGYIPERMTSDPSGFFVVYSDRTRGLICLEHFNNEGVLTTLIEGSTAAKVYHPAVEKKLLSRLDHACYLGRELAKAEQSLMTGKKYVQDAASERSTINTSCGCSNGCS